MSRTLMTDTVRLKIAKSKRVSSLKGVNHPQSVLTDEKVRQIFNLGCQGYSHRSLAKQFGVSKGTVTSILKGWTWCHVTGLYNRRNQIRSNRDKINIT